MPRRQAIVTIMVSTLLAMGFALWNGYASFFNDSRSYVRGGMMVADMLAGHKLAPEWKARSEVGAVRRAVVPPPAPEPPTANRSIYYGVLAFAGYWLSDFWGLVAAQGLVVAILLWLVASRLFGVTQAWRIVAVMAVLAGLTTLGPGVAYVMPDIMAPVAILATALLLLGWARLARGERLLVLALLALALLSHNSHSLILLGMLALALPWLWWRRWPVPGGAVLGLFGALLLAGAGALAFTAAATRISGQRPLLLPHVTAHLIDMGPGMALIRDRCPQIGFAVCAYRDRLPVDWVAFMGSRDPAHGVFANADLPTKRALADEQLRFALAVAAHDPLGLAAGIGRDVVRQLGSFSLATMRIGPEEMANFTAAFPPTVTARIAASRLAGSPAALDLLDGTTLGLSLAALPVLLLTLWRARPGGRREPLLFAALMLAGLVANALVCGGIASPDARFGARVIWLLPLAALALLLWREPARDDG